MKNEDKCPSGMSIKIESKIIPWENFSELRYLRPGGSVGAGVVDAFVVVDVVLVVVVGMAASGLKSQFSTPKNRF